MTPKRPQAQEISSEILSLVMGLNWSVQPRNKGNSQIRFWWPPKGQEGSKFQGVSTGGKTDKISHAEQGRIVAEWFSRNGFKAPVKKADLGDGGLGERARIYIASQYAGSPSATITAVKTHLRRLVAACEKLGALTIQDVSPEVFDAAVPMMKLRERGEGDMGAKRWMGMLFACRKFFKYHILNGPTGRHDRNKFIKEDPTVNQETPPKSATMAKRKVRWTDEEFEETLENIDCDKVQDFVDAMKLLRFAGGLDECDVFELHEDHFTKTKGRYVIKKLRGKHKRKLATEWIRLPIPKKVEPIIKARLKGAKAFNGYLFPWAVSYKNLTCFNAQIYKVVKRARAKAGYPMKHIKALRHSFVTEMISKRVPEGQIQEFLGHVKGSPVVRTTYDLSEYNDNAID